MQSLNYTIQTNPTMSIYHWSQLTCHGLVLSDSSPESRHLWARHRRSWRRFALEVGTEWSAPQTGTGSHAGIFRSCREGGRGYVNSSTHTHTHTRAWNANTSWAAGCRASPCSSTLCISLFCGYFLFPEFPDPLSNTETSWEPVTG